MKYILLGITTFTLQSFASQSMVGSIILKRELILAIFEQSKEDWRACKDAMENIKAEGMRRLEPFKSGLEAFQPQFKGTEWVLGLQRDKWEKDLGKCDVNELLKRLDVTLKYWHKSLNSNLIHETQELANIKKSSDKHKSICSEIMTITNTSSKFAPRDQTIVAQTLEAMLQYASNELNKALPHLLHPQQSIRDWPMSADYEQISADYNLLLDALRVKTAKQPTLQKKLDKAILNLEQIMSLHDQNTWFCSCFNSAIIANKILNNIYMHFSLFRESVTYALNASTLPVENESTEASIKFQTDMFNDQGHNQDKDAPVIKSMRTSILEGQLETYEWKITHK